MSREGSDRPNLTVQQLMGDWQSEDDDDDPDAGYDFSAVTGEVQTWQDEDEDVDGDGDTTNCKYSLYICRFVDM